MIKQHWTMKQIFIFSSDHHLERGLPNIHPSQVQFNLV